VEGRPNLVMRAVTPDLEFVDQAPELFELPEGADIRP
jgi:hypothetical protein